MDDEYYRITAVQQFNLWLSSPTFIAQQPIVWCVEVTSQKVQILNVSI